MSTRGRGSVQLAAVKDEEKYSRAVWPRKFIFNVQWLIYWERSSLLVSYRDEISKKKKSCASGRGLRQEHIKEEISCFEPLHLLELRSA